MSFDLDGLRRAVAAHGRVCRVVVADTRGSTPREVGAAMLVWAGGQSGTIGGGQLEFRATAMARKSIDQDIPHVARLFPLGPDLGQCCGGAVTLSFECFTEDRLPTRFPHAHPVMAMMRMPEAVEALVKKGVEEPTLIEDWLVEPLSDANTRVWIWGAGHVGRAVIDVLSVVPNMALTWIDTAADRFPETVPDGVERALATDPTALVPHAPKDAHHLILTYSHDIDLALCDALLRHGFRTCGLIGSDTKWARFRKRLGQMDHSDAQISRILCPIGDPSLGKHPQAIAIGVAARLLGGQ